MTCLKCGGLMTDERVSDFFHPFTMWRCILCGAVWNRVIYRNRLASRAAGVDMPKFLSEEHRQKWIESVRRTKQAKKQQVNDHRELVPDDEPDSIPSPRLPVPITPGALVAQAVQASRTIEVMEAIDAVLLRMDADRAVLERAKEILSR